MPSTSDSAYWDSFLFLSSAFSANLRADGRRRSPIRKHLFCIPALKQHSRQSDSCWGYLQIKPLVNQRFSRQHVNLGGKRIDLSGGARSRVYYAKNIKGGPDTVTANLSTSSSYLLIYISEYSGLDKAAPIDAQAGASRQRRGCFQRQWYHDCCW